MSILSQLASALGRRDEVPNQELARRLAARPNKKDIAELAAHLQDRDKHIRHDCIKTLYELGEIRPELIADYTEEFVALLGHKDNRMVWGGMCALAAIAVSAPEEIYLHAALIAETMDTGSVITIDHGVLALARVAAHKDAFNKEIFPLLIYRLHVCPAKAIPQYAEKTVLALRPFNREEFVRTIEERIGELSETQLRRVKKVLKQV